MRESGKCESYMTSVSVTREAVIRRRRWWGAALEVHQVPSFVQDRSQFAPSRTLSHWIETFCVWSVSTYYFIRNIHPLENVFFWPNIIPAHSVFIFPVCSCDYRTNYRANLKAHSQTKHDNNISFRCKHPGCSFVTHQRFKYEEHVQEAHPQE